MTLAMQLEEAMIYHQKHRNFSFFKIIKNVAYLEDIRIILDFLIVHKFILYKGLFMYGRCSAPLIKIEGFNDKLIN